MHKIELLHTLSFKIVLMNEQFMCYKRQKGMSKYGLYRISLQRKHTKIAQ